jgi:opacity protein-like surface antigen
MQTAFLVVGLAALASVTAHAQTDVSASLYGAFSGTTTDGSVMKQSPSNAAGGLLEVRHIAKPWFGYEGTYSFNRADQTYTATAIPVACPAPPAICGPYSAAVSANAHEVTGDWVASLKIRNLRPFALAGGGILFDVPSSGEATTTATITGCGGGIPGCVVGTIITSSTSTSSTTKPVFVYGGGVDWGLLPHIGLRLQYRGNLYKVPNLTTLFTSTGTFTHTAEPMIGAYFRF